MIKVHKLTAEELDFVEEHGMEEFTDKLMSEHLEQSLVGFEFDPIGQKCFLCDKDIADNRAGAIGQEYAHMKCLQDNGPISRGGTLYAIATAKNDEQN